MNAVFVAHAGAFALAAVACLGSLLRARRIEHAETRLGLVALLFTSGVWAGANLGYLLVPGAATKQALYVLGLVAGITAVGAWLYFATAYTGRSPRRMPYRRLVVGTLLAFVALKLTNPLHHLYFTATPATDPFAHLAIQHGVLHWVALGLAYALSFVGFYMLLEHLHQAGTDTGPLAVLVGLTALPVGGNLLGATTPWLLAMTYEPLGVAAFALGVLFVYFDQFRSVHLAGEMDDPAVFLDEDDCIRNYNQSARETFPELEGAVGRPLGAVLPSLADQIADGDGVVDLTRGGEDRQFRVTSNPFMAGGSRTGRSLVIVDVTEAERYRRQLEQRTEQLEILNRVVRHDIRNDMAVVIGWGEFLEDHVDEAGEKPLGRVLRTAQHTVGLTESARDFVESLASDGEPELRAIDLGERLETELEVVRESYPRAEFYTPEQFPRVSVRANEMLSSVFRNLLGNAVTHSDQETPEVTVTATVEEGSVVVRVADNGPGVPDAQKETIFGRGEKGLDSEGTGIGLYLVRTLVTQFGGTVWVEDNEPRGAVFVVELPRTD